ncbi:MAG: diguanylate cyclase [Pseudomonadota bacterium]
MQSHFQAISHYLPTEARHWLGLAVLALLYFLAGVIGLTVQTAYNGITPIWPASGIAFAALFLFGVRLWPAIILAMLGLALFAGIPFYVALAAGIGSVLEAVVPVLILRQKQFNGNLNRLNNVLLFVAFAVFLGPVFSATAGVSAFTIHQSLEPDATLWLWAFWWLGNSIGVLMVGSAILIWKAAPVGKTPNKTIGKKALLVLTVIASFTSMAINTYPLSTLILFFMFPLIVFAATHYSMRWVSILYLSALLTFILAGALLFPDKFNVVEIDGIYLNLAFLVVFTFLGLFASAAHSEQLDNRILEYQATTDSLTGMNNRRAFLEQLNTTVHNLRRSDDRHSLLYIDLDGLKAVNDSAGHATGDLVLQASTRIIRRIIRHQDIAGRLGGDEFAILLRNCDSDDAMSIAEKIRRVVSEHSTTAKNKQYSVTTSIGIIDIDPSHHDIPGLLEAADEACYVSKRAGGNQITLADAG